MGLGRLVCGPSGLVDRLEVALGLPPLDSVSQFERVISYREAVRSCLAGNVDAFFRQSFEVDSLSTSRVLLRWRDELRMTGWAMQDERFFEEVPRLQDLAGIESAAPTDAAFRSGLAERIERILVALEKGGVSGIESLTVTDLRESLPQLLRKLLDKLGADFDPLKPDRAMACEGTALHELQSRLLGQRSVAEMGTDSADGTVVVLMDSSEITLARAAVLRWRDPSLVVKSNLAAPLDSRGRLNESLSRMDLATLAFHESSACGSLPQLLPLTLRLLWKPFDPQSWLEFLLHPVSPVPRSLRYRLARGINESPGRGNAEWNRAIESALEKAVEDAHQTSRLKKAIADWLELPAYDRDGGLPGKVVGETSRRLADWMRSVGIAKRVSDDEADGALWLAIAGKVEGFGKAIESLAFVSHQEMERLLADWLQTAGEGVRGSGELGGMPAMADASQVLAPTEHLYWWQPGDGNYHRHPWTRQEREWLSSRGVALITPQAELEAAESVAQRALLQATGSVTFFVLSGEKGAAVSSTVTRVIAELGRGIVSEALPEVLTAPLDVRVLPEPRRWWKLSDPSLLGSREKESFSSISKVIYSPYQWVLNYPAALEKGRLFGFGVCDNSISQGNVLHYLAESLFAPDHGAGEVPVDWKRFDESSLRRWIEESWPGLLDRRAAHYRLPGLESARNRLLHTGRRALWQLVRHLQEAGVTSVEVEKYVDGVSFAGVQLNGRIDLVARTPAAVCVIDLKLGGRSMRQAELEQNRHLQLAVYGHLLRMQEGSDPHAAFFILGPGGALLTRSNEFFPGAFPVKRKDVADATEWSGCWEEFEQVWKWRRAQLDTGLIEVTVSGTEADREPPLAHWAASADADYYNDFDALTGWLRNT